MAIVINTPQQILGDDLYQNYLDKLYEQMKKEETQEMNAALEAPKGFTFGADPELFITTRSGKLVSAAGLIPGTKADPHKVEGGAVQVDGMAAEFNIDPVSTFEEFDGNIEKVMAALKKMLPKGHKFHIVPSVEFPEAVFQSAPEEAKELGCSPDCNAWTGELNTPPHCEDRPFLRCAGGHIHFGWGTNLDLGDAQHILNCRDLVKQLDWYLGAWSLVADPAGKDRRLLYGKAGAHRPKDYGVEYRVLSNFWIVDREHRLEVWNRMITAINMMSQKHLPTSAHTNVQKRLISAIDTSTRDKDLESSYRNPIMTIKPRSISRW